MNAGWFAEHRDVGPGREDSSPRWALGSRALGSKEAAGTGEAGQAGSSQGRPRAPDMPPLPLGGALGPTAVGSACLSVRPASGTLVENGGGDATCAALSGTVGDRTST